MHLLLSQRWAFVWRDWAGGGGAGAEVEGNMIATLYES